MQRRAKPGLTLLGVLVLSIGAAVASDQPYALEAAYPTGPPPNSAYQKASRPAGHGATAARQFDPAMANAGMWQIERLPPVDATTPLSVDPAAKYAQDFPGGLLLPDDDPTEDEQSLKKGLPPGMRRPGFFQGITMGGSWLATGTGHDALGISAADVGCEFVLPSLIPDSLFLITPRFAVHRFDNPGGHDIPNEVYDATVGFGLKGRLSERLSYQTDVTVGSHSDFENDNGEQVRVRGFGSAMWKWTPTVDLTFGVAYVDLQDWPVLPVGGLIIRPDDARIIKLGFPRMEYSRRLAATGALGPQTEYWGSVGLELCGGRWLVRTGNGSTDDLTYRDWRLTLGLDQKTLDAYDLHFDVGYVFARRIEYDDEHESFAPDDTFSITLTGRF